MLKGKWYQRKDIEVKNKRGDVIQCSHYVPILNPDGKPLPCVIYCHGNSGCRADASEAAIILLPSNITVFTLDFSGSGLSGGEHVTLGWNEKDDLKAVVDYLRADGNVSMIGLWGRSMGAVTSLLYGAEDPSIAGMVLDSPFSDLVDLMMELVDTYKIRLPKFTVKFAIQYMRKAIQKKAKFDITDLNTIKSMMKYAKAVVVSVAKSCFVPVLFGHAVEDDFINPHHSDRIFEAYAGDKNIIKFEGDHNSPRPQFYFDSINIFFHNVLQPPEDEVGPTLIGTMHDYFGKGNLSTLHELGYFQEPSTASAEPSATSTADAIEQVRSKRPMSRTEDKQIGGTLSRSASNMISFELSDGHPYGPHVPTAMDDDQYVEYQLDDLAGFPSNVEEEERMFMEAVIMSLKDLEMRHPEVEQPTSVAADSFKSSGQGATNDCSTTDHCKPSESETSSSSIEQLRPMYTESTSTSLVNSRNLAPQHPSPDTSVSSVGDAFDTPPSSVESASTGTSARTDTSATASTQSSADADVSSNTKATVTVVKNPAGHVMEGLMRRWDLNFFRNR
ncbi:Hydrolase 4 domain-containing protein [Citrus sinensis]|uniref:Hydrolase 4 domain-containing protein n=1 Tax=Citrus sinensis TaxID=2711 RepID=A0ACB8I7N2_CITSI|nr:Hydrolase 4 domain-containing protein [Citrus sinensis]